MGRERFDYAKTARLARDTLAILEELLEQRDYDDRMLAYARMAGDAFRLGDAEGVKAALGRSSSPRTEPSSIAGAIRGTKVVPAPFVGQHSYDSLPEAQRANFARA